MALKDFMQKANPRKALMIAILLFLNVLILGCLFLVAAGKVAF